MRPSLRTTSAFALATLITVTAPAWSADAALVEGATASAFGVRAHLGLLGTDLLTLGPLPYASVPDSDQDPNTSSATAVGPYRFPENGSLVGDLRVLSAQASRKQGALPRAKGESQVSNVALLGTGSTPLLQADVIHAVSTTRCTAPGRATASAEGSRLVGLFINGTAVVDQTPAPNTIIPLIYNGGTPADPSDDRAVKIILNEQTGASRGAGLIVTMIHVIVYDAVASNVVYADIRIADARSSVFCGTATPPTNNNGDDRGVESDKVATSTTSDVRGASDGTEATAYRSDEVTWTVKLTNTGDAGCGLIVVTDTLPAHFTFVKTSGDLSKGAEATVEGQKITWSNPDRWTLLPGGTLTETIVAKVDPDAPFGTYTNLIEIEESTCSAFTQGLLGPVTVIPRTTVLPRRIVAPLAPLPATGSSSNPMTAGLAAMALVALGVIALRRADA